ncbi:alpha/beta fold hydrolase [Microbacterium sp. CJ88]|uniref:alpha/beta fold hydrolase n=1 Tax=Microbacterium sp. CJ88 TaxID=3445672 RepID=UPI003F657328
MIEVLGDSGPAVLLLPGGAEGVDGFFPGLLEGLREDPGCRIILYDRPGNGPSNETEGLSKATAALHAAIAEAGTGPVVAIGQSLGGAVAVMLAADYPEDVAGLVLIDPTPVHDPELAAKIAKQTDSTVKLMGMPVIGGLLSGMLRRSAEKSARKHNMAPEMRAATLKIADLDAPKLGRALTGMEAVSKRLDTSKIQGVPAVVITADRKRGHVFRRAHETLAAQIGAPVLSWPGVEHQGHLTHPAEVLEASRDVIRAASA